MGGQACLHNFYLLFAVLLSDTIDEVGDSPNQPIPDRVERYRQHASCSRETRVRFVAEGQSVAHLMVREPWPV